MRKNLAERLEEKIERIPECGCWLFTGALNNKGYGFIGAQTERGWRMSLAHRASYELRFGKIQPGLLVLHSCDQPSCVNPHHLRVGTHQDNSNDKMAKGRCRTGAIKGMEQVGSKLSDENVIAIRAKYKTGKFSQRELAMEYGVSKHPIQMIVTGKNWKHVV